MSTRIKRVLGLRSSGASGAHASKANKRSRTRAASKRRAIREES